MESFFGIGGAELVLILVLATVILGPLRMIRMARQFGVLLRDLRNYYTQLTAGLNEELAVLAEAKGIVQDGIESAAIKPEDLQVTITDAPASPVETPAPAPDASLTPEAWPPALSASESVSAAPTELPSSAAEDIAQAATAGQEYLSAGVAPGSEGLTLTQETTDASAPAAEPLLALQNASLASESPLGTEEPADQTASESAPAPEMMQAPEIATTSEILLAQADSQEQLPPPALPERAVAVNADELGLL